MNATPTTLCDALWRGQRGIARGLLLAGALAGMTLGTVAHAQIAFRAASSATQPVPTFRAASSATAVFPLSAPTFVSAGARATGTGAITPALPASILVDDILLLFLETSNEVITIANPSGGTWTAVTNSPQFTGTAATTAATRLTVFWSRYNGTQTAPVTSDSGNRQLGRIIAVRGVDPSGDPSNITAGGVEAGNTDTSGSIPGATTTVANTLVVAAIATSLPDLGSTAVFTDASWANANLTSVTERTDDSTATGVGGALGVATGVKAAAGLYAATTVTTSVATAKAMMSIVLRPPAATLTITKPALTATNDVMIASFGFRTNQPGVSLDIVITPPAGWTLVNRRDNPDTGDGGADNGLAVYRKTAGASEPANYTWAFSCTLTCATYGFQAAEGGILSFYNVDTTSASPINVEQSAETVMGAQTTPSVTTSVANAMLVASHTFASAGTWVPTPGGPLGAMNEAVDVQSGSQATEINWLLQAAAGATGGYRASPSLDDDAGNAHILALRPAQQSAITINKPAGTVQNDVMIATIGFRPNTLTVTPPVGWTIVRRIDTTDTSLGGAPSSLEVYWRTAGAGEPANYTWTASAAGYLAGGILSFSGVDTAAATPIDIDAGNCTLQPFPCPNLTLAHATLDVTTTMANTMLVTSHAYASAGTWTPTGMTEAVDVQHGNQSLSANYVAQAAAGATGTKTATASSDADIGTAHILALKPFVSVPTPGSFNAFETSTAAGAITGVIKTKIAGSAFSLDVVAIASGAQQAGFTDAVIVELLGNNTLGVALDAQNCPTSFTLVQTVAPNPTITGGRSTVSFAVVPNSWRDVRVRVRWPTTSPTVTWCSTDNFAIRPNTLASFAVTDNDWQTAGLGRTLDDVTFILPPPGGAGKVHKAGRPLSVRATAVNAAGTPATTTNYTGAPTATFSTCGSAACTATFGTLTLTTTFVAGQLASDVASYNDVGSFALQLVDSTFASVDAADTTGDCSASGRYVCSTTINVGRFVPDHFAVALNTPVFSTACGTSFTYVGQRFNYATQPVIIVTARDFASNTTTFYEGVWWRITNANLTGKAYTAATGTLDLSGLPGTDPAIFAVGAGTGTLTFSSGTGIFFDRTTPVVPFDAEISLAINVIDDDGVAFATNPARFGTATAGSGIAFNNAKEMRFGQLVISNAHGSQLVPLQLRMEVQYWNGTAFVTNAGDGCTSLAATNIEMENFAQNLGACETSLTVGAFSNGRATAQLSGPGSSNTGSVSLIPRLDLSVSGTPQTCIAGTLQPVVGANRPYLKPKWDSTDEGSDGLMFDDDPEALANFGTYRGAGEVIFIRENF